VLEGWCGVAVSWFSGGQLWGTVRGETGKCEGVAVLSRSAGGRATGEAPAPRQTTQFTEPKFSLCNSDLGKGQPATPKGWPREANHPS